MSALAAFFVSIWSRVAEWVAGLGLLLSIVVAIYLSGRRSGAERVERRQAETNLDARERADAAGTRYRGDGGARGRLHDRTF